MNIFSSNRIAGVCLAVIVFASAQVSASDLSVSAKARVSVIGEGADNPTRAAFIESMVREVVIAPLGDDFSTTYSKARAQIMHYQDQYQ
ncbi:MAG: hypothetical protein QNJ97_22580 [Myxococcota bacterium]|nr:hypothetical protein [Myxococcota bacterium]